MKNLCICGYTAVDYAVLAHAALLLHVLLMHFCMMHVSRMHCCALCTRCLRIFAYAFLVMLWLLMFLCLYISDSVFLSNAFLLMHFVA